MKLIFTHENKIIVENARNFLNTHDIASVLKNDILAGAAGELSPTETWPELWVSEVNFERAEQLVQQLISEPIGNPWTCIDCGEENEPSFELCWKCQKERPEVA